MYNKKTSLKEVFEGGIAGIHETHDVLARIFRIVIWKTNLPYTSWVNMLNRWVTNTQPPHTEKAARHTCGNLSKALKEPRISWKMFLKALAIMEVTKMDISMTFYRGDKEVKVDLTVDNILSIVLANDKADKEKAELKKKSKQNITMSEEEEDDDE